MRPFRFRLERLKKVRFSQERAARNTFISALGEHTRAESALRKSLSRRDTAREELRQILAAGNSASSFLTAQRATDRFDTLVVAARQKHTHAGVAADQARAKWVVLRSKHEGLSRLRSARKSEHHRETERFLARELDEVAMTRAAGNGYHVDNSPTPTKSSP